jgi:hypothetical protein
MESNVIIRTPGGTYKHTQLHSLANLFHSELPRPASTVLPNVLGNYVDNVLGNNDEDDCEFDSVDSKTGAAIESSSQKSSTKATLVPPATTIRATRRAVANSTVPDYCPISLQFYTRKYVTHSAAFDPNQMFEDEHLLPCGCQEISCSTNNGLPH